MNLLPTLFFAVIGIAMYRTLGHNSDSSGPYTIAFYAVIAVMVFRKKLAPVRERLWLPLLALIATGSLIALIHDPVIIYGERWSQWLAPFGILLWGALACALLAFVSLLVPASASPKWRERSRIAARLGAWAGPAAVLLIFGAQLFVPLISPQPYIDVFVNNTLAVNHFLHGVNPYTQAYPDIYHGRYDYKPSFPYFPGLLYWLAPFRALFGDTRYGYVFANLLIALGLGGLARKLRAPKPLRWLAPLLWLSFPVTFFVLEQSWIDTVLIALTVLIFWSIEEEKWVLSGVLMGAAFSFKQYGFLIGLIACIHIWRNKDLRTAAKAAGAGALTAAAVLLPFALADWTHFYASTITTQAASAVRLDAYNATSFLALDLHWMLPTAAQVILSVLGIAGGALYVARKRSPRLADSAIALLLGYGTAFLFGKFAFCNYHYLLAGLLLLYLVSACPESVRPESRRTTETSEAPSARVGT